MNVLLKVSGSISVYKLCKVVSSLKKLGHKVKVASSQSALNFVGGALWEGLSGEKVFSDDFSPNQRMDHIHLNNWADVIVLAPASANTLNSIAKGVGSGVINTLFLARNASKPYLIFPAMNPKMWGSDSVKKSVEKLNKLNNVRVFEPDQGLMACGHTGKGRLNDPSFILDAVLKHKRFEKSVLVTLGGTSESIDGVRMITNFSTGRTGIEVARALKKKFNVTALASQNAIKGVEGLEGVKLIPYLSFDELSSKLQKELREQSYDMIVHAAAVSDFLPKQTSDAKISSSDEFKIEFKKAPKILDSLKSWSKNKNIRVVSFKLTHNQEENEVLNKIQNQFLNKKSDFVIHNELSSVNAYEHKYTLWKDSNALAKGESKEELVKDLGELLC